MAMGFFEHPLWVNFQRRPIWVVSLAEPEHRIRDALALQCLRDFLKPEFTSNCMFETVTIGPQQPRWPKVPKDAAIVVVGRPSLFGVTCLTMIEQATPPLLYRFESNDPGSPKEYRSIKSRGDGSKSFEGASFKDQRKRGKLELSDLGIVYAGWFGKRPLLVFAGSSTVGTWGAVKFGVDDAIGPNDLRWHCEVQGIVAAQVADGPETFAEVAVTQLEVLAPTSIWMAGRDLPPRDKWLDFAVQFSNRDCKIEILVNGERILNKSRSPLVALTLLHWASSNPTRIGDFVLSHITVPDAFRRIQRFLPSAEQSHVNQTLNRLLEQIRKANGIAFKDVVPSSQAASYWLCSRPIPAFLPTF